MTTRARQNLPGTPYLSFAKALMRRLRTWESGTVAHWSGNVGSVPQTSRCPKTFAPVRIQSRLCKIPGHARRTPSQECSANFYGMLNNQEWVRREFYVGCGLYLQPADLMTRLQRLIGILGLICVCALSAAAQQGRGELQIDVRDPQGATLSASGELVSEGNR